MPSGQCEDSRILGSKSLIALDIQHEDNGAANLDFEIFSQIQETRFEGWRIGNRDLGSTFANGANRFNDPLDVMIFYPDNEACIAGSKQAAGTAHPSDAEVCRYDLVHKIVGVFILYDRDYELHSVPTSWTQGLIVR